METRAQQWRKRSNRAMLSIAAAALLSEAAHGQNQESSGSDWQSFDLATQDGSISDREASGAMDFLDNRLPPVDDDGEGLEIRIARPDGAPLSRYDRAISIAAAGSQIDSRRGGLVASELEIQLDDGNGLNLTTSFGLTSQPLRIPNGPAIITRSFSLREDRATAKIGIRF